MKQTNEMKFSSYGVWDLIRKVYQNKEDLLPKMGFKKFEEFLDWFENYGDQDTQDEFEDIVNKYEKEKASPMTENKLKQVIKEEIKRVLSKNTNESYQIPSISPSSSGGGGRRFIPTQLPFPSRDRKKFGTHIVYNSGNDTVYISAVLYNNLVKGYAHQPSIKKLIMDIPMMVKQLLNKPENYGPIIELPKEHRVYHPFNAPVEKAESDKFSKAGKQYWAEGDLLFPNLNAQKYRDDLSENSDHNKNAMVRGMINMLKRPEIKNASFEDLMNMNIAIQNLLPPPTTIDPDSPSNIAAIKAMRDMDREK